MDAHDKVKVDLALDIARDANVRPEARAIIRALVVLVESLHAERDELELAVTTALQRPVAEGSRLSSAAWALASEIILLGQRCAEAAYLLRGDVSSAVQAWLAQEPHRDTVASLLEDNNRLSGRARTLQAAVDTAPDWHDLSWRLTESRGHVARQDAQLIALQTERDRLVVVVADLSAEVERLRAYAVAARGHNDPPARGPGGVGCG